MGAYQSIVDKVSEQGWIMKCNLINTAFITPQLFSNYLYNCKKPLCVAAAAVEDDFLRCAFLRKKDWYYSHQPAWYWGLFRLFSVCGRLMSEVPISANGNHEHKSSIKYTGYKTESEVCECGPVIVSLSLALVYICSLCEGDFPLWKEKY